MSSRRPEPDGAKKLFHVRLAEARDDESLGELLIQSFQETYATKLPDVVVSERRKADLRRVAERREQACVFVLERLEDSLLAGTVALFPPAAPGSEAWLPQAADLRQLSLAPSFQGQGLASLLLDAAEQKARDWKCPSICLHVRREAEGVARLYESRGFRRDPSGDLDLLPEIFLNGYALSLQKPDTVFSL